MTRLDEEFWHLDTLEAARQLLGIWLCRPTATGLLAGRIIETEAYTEDDPASHSFRGPTARNAAMFGPAGRAYIYFIYGNHYCFNVVTGPQGRGEAVLVRALQPISGVQEMRANRFGPGPAAPRDLRDLTNGPGKLCQALSLDKNWNGIDLRGEALFLARPESGYPPAEKIGRGARIGISKAQDWPRRFWLEGYAIKALNPESGGNQVALINRRVAEKMGSRQDSHFLRHPPIFQSG